MHQTISEELTRTAEYYQTGHVADQVEGLALEVSRGFISFSDALDRLMVDYIDAGGDLDDDLKVEHRFMDKLDAECWRIEQNLPKVVVRTTGPLAAAGLGVSDGEQVDMHQIGSMLAGRKADGDLIEDKKYSTERTRVDERTGEVKYSTPIGSYDFTVTPDKSFSVAWAFADELERAQLYNCLLQASREAVAYIGDQVAHARKGNGGEEGYEQGEIAVMEFTHHTARKVAVTVEDGAAKIVDSDAQRPADPHVHIHNLIPNAVFCESGHVGSLDTMGIRGFIREASLYFEARFATLLNDAGYDAYLDEKTGSARMSSVPDDIRTNFSKRSNTGEQLARIYTASKGEVWDALTEDQRDARIGVATKGLDQKKNGEKDDVANFEDWQHQAKELGWEPTTFRRQEPAPERLSEEERNQKAYDTALPWLAGRLEQNAVIQHFDLRVAALRGLVATRCDGLDDIDAVTKIMREKGVTQYGERTALLWGKEEGKRYISVTTSLHESDEKEFVALGKAAAADKSGVIPERVLQKHIRQDKVDFGKDAHGKSQVRAMHTINSNGRFAVVTGVAGSGKTTMLRPLLAAKIAMGGDVHGAALAWDRADELIKAGIPERNLKAFSVLLKAMKEGNLVLTPQSTVAVDEWGMLGTRQALELLRAQAKMGFTIISTGDEKQLKSIEAGNLFDLSRRILGEASIPEITTTKRQQGEEAKILSLFRDNKPGEALSKKRDAGDAEMVYGGRDGVMKRVTEIYLDHLKTDKVAPGVIAPTNNDAHQISVMVRTARRELGMVGPDVHTLKATDGDRNYALHLAKGDRVRLFKSTKAEVEKGKYRSIGRNGSVMDVLAVDRSGMTLRNTKNGKTGSLKWEAIRQYPGDAATPQSRYMLAYGDAATVHTSQGSEGPVKIFALPSGSKAIAGGMGYSAMTRGEKKNIIVTSELHEKIGVKDSRPINDPHEITEADKWAHVARQFINDSKADSALALRDRVATLKRGTVVAFQKALVPDEPGRKTGSPNVAMNLMHRQMDVAMVVMQQAVEATKRAYKGMSL